MPAGVLQNLSRLDQINLGHNSISLIDDFAFVAVPTVTYILLNNNNLVAITGNMFAGLFMLDDLRLSDNSISSIETGSFKDTPLKYLWLYGNVMPCQSRHVMSRHVMPITTRHVTSRHFSDVTSITSHHIMTCHVRHLILLRLEVIIRECAK